MAKYEGFGLACGKFKSKDVAGHIFGGENTLQTQMKVEAALAKAQAALGIIPQSACDEISSKCDVGLLDEGEYLRQHGITNHHLVALIRCYAQICEGDAGEYVHYGATTQDITDNATMLQLKEAHEIIKAKVRELRGILAEKARRYRSLVVMGRTNDQQALPITLGFRLATWVDELDRSIARLTDSEDRIFVGQFAGAVGTLASLEQHGLEIQKRLLQELGLGIPPIAWYTTRDRLVELASNLCILTCSLGRFANEVYNNQKTEVDEMAEGFRPGRVGSSTMAHKRNPFVPAAIVAYGRQARSVMVDALTVMEGTNERDVRTLFMEDEFLAKACSLADAALDASIALMTDLEIHENSVRRNLQLSNGLVFTEAIMMRLSKEYGRMEAHEIVYQIAQQAISENCSYRELLLRDERVRGKLTENELDTIMDPSHYIGLSEYFVNVVIGE